MRLTATALLCVMGTGCAALTGPDAASLEEAFHAQLQGVDFLQNLERNGDVITFDIPGSDQGMFRVKPSSWTIKIVDVEVAPNDDEMKPWIGRIESDWSQVRDGKPVQGDASLSIPRGITDRGIGPSCGAYWGTRTKQWNWVGGGLGPIRRSGPAAKAEVASAGQARDDKQDDLEAQRQSMARIRSVATAVESYSIDRAWYPTGGSVNSLRDRLVPTYIKELPTTDGWDNEIRYLAWEGDETDGGPTNYVLVSPGRDGRFEIDDARSYKDGATDTFDSDIVFETGGFKRYPEGPQR